MDLASRVLQRHRVAKVLDKAWLMAVKRGWKAMLDQLQMGSKSRIDKTFDAIRAFLNNLDEQIRFVQRATFVNIRKLDPAGQAFDKADEKLREEVTRVENLAFKLIGDMEFAIDRYLKKLRELEQQKGVSSLYKLLPKEDLDSIVTQDHEDAAIIKHVPEIEETLKAKNYASNIFHDWIQHGWPVERAKIDRRFDAMMKLLYEEAAKLKEMQEKGQEPEDEEVFTSFDLYGMKVIVDDRTVAPIQVKQYIKYLDAAYHMLKAKHLEKVWYGTVFIRCEACGGYNYNTGRNNDVGGNYPIGPDVVNIFSRPSSFIIELMAHELGHRYWFKFMHEGQRGKFESLVKVHNRPKPRHDTLVMIIPQEKRMGAKRRVEEAVAVVNEGLYKFKDQKRARGMWWKRSIENNYQAVASMGHPFFNAIIDAVHSAGADSTINPEVKRLFNAVLETSGVLQKKLFNLDPDLIDMVHKTPEPSTKPKSFDTYWWSIYEVQRDIWVREAQQLLTQAEQAAKDYVDGAVAAYNEIEQAKKDKQEKEWTEEYDKDTREVTPVSNYGKSNIDEAFAEAFMHYVMEFDMNRDQLESFRSVLSSTASEGLFQAFLTML